MSMEKIRVFISYNHELEKKLIELIKEGIGKLDNIELLIDTDYIPYSGHIYERVLRKIDECHCILTSLISINNSNEVKSELIRGHAKKKEFIIIDDKRNHQPELPPYLFFLKHRKRFSYNTEIDLINNLKNYFQNKTIKDFEKLPTEVFALLRELDKRYLNDNLKFKRHLIKKIISEAHEEISKVYDQQYITDVGIEKNFLVRAKSIFENATKVYAFSIDRVSTFWEKENNHRLAVEYIKSQPKNTVRLFAFSSARNANRYVNILQANHLRYGEEGRVYICSKDSYRNLIDNFKTQNNINEYFHQDFGILFHESSPNDIIMEAILDDTQLKFKFIDLNYPEKINHQKLILQLDDLRELNYQENSSSKIPNVSIKRWNPECLNNTSQWVKELKQLFPEPKAGEAYHCVCFKNTNDPIRSIILEIKNEIEYKSQELGIKSMWFGRQAEMKSVIDSNFKGEIKISKDYDYLLLIKFASKEDMEKYYEVSIHGELREKLYRQMNEELDFMYKCFKDSNKKMDKSFVFEKIIEEIVSKHMIRYDFVDLENIDSIVFQKRISFNIDAVISY